MRVAVGRQHLEHPVFESQNGNVERSSPQIVDGDCDLLRPIQAIRQGSRGRFVHDAHDVQSGDLPGVTRRLPLRIVKLSGDRDHRSRDRPAEMTLRAGLKLAQDHGAEFGRCVYTIADFNDRHVPAIRTLFSPDSVCESLGILRQVGQTPPHQTFHGINRR